MTERICRITYKGKLQYNHFLNANNDQNFSKRNKVNHRMKFQCKCQIRKKQNTKNVNVFMQFTYNKAN